MPRWITLEIFPSRHLAEMMSELLSNEGVVSVVSVDDAGGLRPDLANTLGAHLRVAPEDEERARWILDNLTPLDEFENDEDPPEV
jgi:hypothetical protein